MAKIFIDSAIPDSRDDMAEEDGAALTLTGDIRIVYDNTKPFGDLVTLIHRMADKMRQENS